nr:protein SDE2 homolog [Ipomoea batatas]
MEVAGIHQVLVKLLDGKHRIINFSTPSVSIQTLKHRIETLTLIPTHLQLLIPSDSPYLLQDNQTLNLTTGHHQSKFPVVVNLLLRLRGGKGGFGSLLRGAATKAGQKKTNNFDACRDMSGRRLRHKKGSGIGSRSKTGESADKYVSKYREDSAKCMEEVERSVRESLKGFIASKRKAAAAELNDSDSKKLKIWMGKRKFDDSDSEDSDEDENEKSVIGNNSDSSRGTNASPLGTSFASESGTSNSSGSAVAEEIFDQQTCYPTSGEEGTSLIEARSDARPKEGEGSVKVADPEWDEISSAEELEALGMEKLKSELQVRGLKCGGTLQERAARLFLLKTTPLEMLPKKLLALRHYSTCAL